MARRTARKPWLYRGRTAPRTPSCHRSRRRAGCSRLRRELWAGTALAILLAISPAGRAADLAIGGWISQRIEADSNIGLDPSDPGPASVATTDLGLRVARETPRLRWAVEPGLRARVAIGEGVDTEDGLNAVQPRLSASTHYTGRRFTIEGRLDFSRESTEFTRFDDSLLFDNGVFVPNPSLLTDDETVETRLDLDARWALELDRRNALALRADARFRRYDERVEGLVPTTTIGTEIGWTREAGPRTRIGADLGLRRFTADNASETRSLSLDISGRVSHRPTPRHRTDARLGLNLTRTEERVAQPGRPRDEALTVGITGRLGLDYTRPRGRISVAASQGVQPSSDGALRNITALTLSLSHALSPRAKLRFTARQSFDTALGRGGGVDRFLSLGPELSISLAPRWRFGLGLSARISNDTGGNATSVNAFATLSRSFGRDR